MINTVKQGYMRGPKVTTVVMCDETWQYVSRLQAHRLSQGEKAPSISAVVRDALKTCAENCA